MSNLAATAAMSDRENILWFSRRWSERHIPLAPATAAAGSIVRSDDKDDGLRLLVCARGLAETAPVDLAILVFAAACLVLGP